MTDNREPETARSRSARESSTKAWNDAVLAFYNDNVTHYLSEGERFKHVDSRIELCAMDETHWGGPYLGHKLELAIDGTKFVITPHTHGIRNASLDQVLYMQVVDRADTGKAVKFRILKDLWHTTTSDDDTGWVLASAQTFRDGIESLMADTII